MYQSDTRLRASVAFYLIKLPATSSDRFITCKNQVRSTHSRLSSCRRNRSIISLKLQPLSCTRTVAADLTIPRAATDILECLERQRSRSHRGMQIIVAHRKRRRTLNEGLIYQEHVDKM